MGSALSVKARSDRRVASQLRQQSGARSVKVANSGATVEGRQRNYVQRPALFDAIMVGTPYDAVSYPEHGPLAFLSYNDLCVVPLLGRAFFEATGGNIHVSECPWVRALYQNLLPTRMPMYLKQICTAPGKKVLQCGDGMDAIFFFKYRDRSTVVKHYAAFVPFIEGDINYMGIPWSMPFLNHGVGDANHNHNHEAMEALHSGQWEKASEIMLSQCTNGRGVLLKLLSPQKVIDCSVDRIHAEVRIQSRLQEWLAHCGCFNFMVLVLVVFLLVGLLPISCISDITRGKSKPTGESSRCSGSITCSLVTLNS